MEHAPDTADNVRLRSITQEELPYGRIRVRFEIGRYCCVDSGKREFEIALLPDRSTVTLILEHNLPVRRGEGDHEWKETHDFCYAFSARLATRDCLEWIRDHLLPPEKPRIARDIVVSYQCEERERDLRDLHRIGFIVVEEFRVSFDTPRGL